MKQTIRDTAFGHLVRFASRGKFLKYPEEADPSLCQDFIDPTKSGNLADHGTTGPREEGAEQEEVGGNGQQDSQSAQKTASRPSSSRQLSKEKGESDDSTINEPSGVRIDPEKGKDAHLVTWRGQDDPDNPQNWSRFKRCFVTFQICLLTMSVYIGSAIYSAGTQDVMQTFGVSQVAATLGLCLYVAGYGLGPLVWSPMSEIPQIGRNPVYLGTLVVFVALQPAVARAENFGMLLAFRFITGFFGSPVLATGGASLGDIWRPKKRAYALGIWGVAAITGPTMGPLVGGFAVQYAPVKGGFTSPWTWPIWELMWLSGFCLVFLVFLMPETSANNILLRRTKRLRKITGNTKLICEPELMAQHMTGKDLVMMTLVRPITLNFTEPMVFLLNLYIALIYGLLYIWFESFYIVFVEIHGFGLGAEGLAFLGIFVGGTIVIPPFFAYLYYVLEPQFDEAGNIEPEKRLLPCFVGAFCIPICLFIFGFTSKPDIHWMVPIFGSAFFSIGAFLLFNSILNYLGDAYPDYAASVFAGNDFMRSAFGAGFPLFAGAMYTKLGVDWASGTLAFISIAFIPIPFVLYKYGKTLRKNYSRHARKDI